MYFLRLQYLESKLLNQMRVALFVSGEDLRSLRVDEGVHEVTGDLVIGRLIAAHPGQVVQRRGP